MAGRWSLHTAVGMVERHRAMTPCYKYRALRGWPENLPAAPFAISDLRRRSYRALLGGAAARSLPTDTHLPYDIARLLLTS